jgi:hypothetical protein
MFFRSLQAAWRYLLTCYVPHQGHGLDYEAPHQAGAPAVEAAR